MICYKDRTFCNAPCATYNCPHMLTAQVIKDAREWWKPCSGDAPIAVNDYSDTCPEFKPIKDSQ